MVMEAPHSAQLVGREFVRQYYTLLNQAPNFLHRFYNNNSSFIHGGVSNKDRDIIPTIGQKEIHRKIQQLKFCDCHTRINQVDSQATLDDGVVVQVTGEFSNAGNPMRRFTQTFVLAAQAPKKYYVHNDIFRYQDGFSHDEGDDIEGDACLNEVNECEADEGRSEAEDDDQVIHQTSNVPDQGHPGHITAQQPPLHTNPQQMYYATPSQVTIPLVINGNVHDESPLITQQLPQQPPAQQPQYIEQVTQEQFSQEQDVAVEQPPPSQPQPTPTQQQQVPTVVSAEDENNGASEESTEQQQQQVTSENFQQQQQPTNEPESETHNATANISNNRPKSYARTVRSNVIGGSSQVPKSSISPPPMSNIRNEDRPVDIWNAGSANLSSNAISAGQQHRMSNNQSSQQQQTPQQQQQQPGHQQRDQQRDQQQHQRPPRIGPTQKDNRGRRDWPDNHQLFVGNVSHQATDIELRGIFEKFGRVVDLRIFSKSNERGKGPQGQNNSMRVPHYGFVTFEDSTVVAKVLAAHGNKPICYPDETGQKLNIEEKKNKPRTMGDNNMRSNQNDGNMRSSMGGQQQQQQRGPGGLGVMRGGQHPRGGRGFSRDGGRGGMRQPGGNMGNPGYQHRRQ